MRRRTAQCFVAMALAALASGCGERGTPYVWRLPEGFPPPRVPEDNLLTLEKIELGRHLFYDARLSGNGTQACASCHIQARAFSEPAATATGSTGASHRRNSMALVNVAYNATFTWAHAGIDSVERHMLLPLFGDAPLEMAAAGHEAEILARLAADSEYQRLFARAYPGARERFTFDHAVKALASFVRTLNSFDSPFDRYAYRGEDAALSESQLRGMNLFMSERLECSHCHGGFNFSQFVTHESSTVEDRMFHVTGLYWPGTQALSGVDRGLFAATGELADLDKFKAPTLRNVEVSAPYMHDGSLATLDAVIDFYAAGGRDVPDGPQRGDGRLHPGKSAFVRGFTLTPEEREDVLSFLKSLTDREFLSNQRLADPWPEKQDALRAAHR